VVLIHCPREECVYCGSKSAWPPETLLGPREVAQGQRHTQAETKPTSLTFHVQSTRGSRPGPWPRLATCLGRGPHHRVFLYPIVYGEQGNRDTVCRKGTPTTSGVLSQTKARTSLQGYLAHKKTPTPLGPPQAPGHRPTIGS